MPADARPPFTMGAGCVLALALCAAACASSTPDRPGYWGSDQANLTVQRFDATLHILAPGDCYGSYGEFDPAGPLGRTFTFPGTYTQLIGAYPGKIEYPAEFSGSIAGSRMSLSFTVPDLQQSFGPFTLTYGLSEEWPACAYP